MATDNIISQPKGNSITLGNPSIQSLFELVNDYAIYLGIPKIDKNTFIITLSSLQSQGYIETKDDNVFVLKEYPNNYSERGH